MIKYRVWDNTEQKYDYDGYSIGCDSKLYKSGGVIELAEDYTIEQYTGLKDKNGTEIASGDIVKRRTANYEKQVFEDEYGVVKYEKGSFYVDFRGNRDNLMLRYGEPEVIGNIHENAELLEEE